MAKLNKKYALVFEGDTEAEYVESEDELEERLEELDDDGTDVEEEVEVYELGQKYRVEKSNPKFELVEAD